MGQVGAYFLDLGRGSASAYFAVNKNSVFKQNSKKPKTYLKIRYFLEKSCKTAAAFVSSVAEKVKKAPFL